MRSVIAAVAALLAVTIPARADAPPPLASTVPPALARDLDETQQSNQPIAALVHQVLAAMRQHNARLAVFLADDFLKRPDLDAEARFAGYSLRAALLLHLGVYDGALRDVERALALRPDTMALLARRAQIHFRQQRFADAAADAAQMLALHPANGAAEHIKGDVAIEEGRFGEAVTDFTAELRAIQNPNANVLRALAEERLGQHDAARADITAAAEQGDLKAAQEFEPMAAALAIPPAVPAAGALAPEDAALPDMTAPGGHAGIAGLQPANSHRNDYPPLSRRLGEVGIVLVSFIVGTDGAPRDIAVVQPSGFPRLDAAAVASVTQWRYVPATRDGVATAVRTEARLVWSEN